MASTKDIQRRIKSVGNTQKITRAMEMVSAAKMRKASASVLSIRPYAHAAWEVLTNLSRAFAEYNSGLLEVREVKKVLAVVITSNRGLCGAFNYQIMKKITQELEHPERLKINRSGRKKIESTQAGLEIEFVTVGRKGEAALKRLGHKVVVFYTDYVSAMSQQAKVRQLLPISKIDLEKQIAEMDEMAKEYGLAEAHQEYKVEPTPRSVLEYIFPRLIEMQVFHAILETNASKESARMLAMRNATDAAGEMKDSLTFAYNQIRQGKITQEIAEISAGRAALEN